VKARLLAASMAFLSMASVASAAIADVTKRQCVDANTQAQSLRRDGKLDAARAQLQRCGQSACPAMVRADCARRLDDLENAQPTIIFDVRDGSGHDLIDVRVTVDGRPLADRLDGKALRIDPGAHAFAFTATDQPPVTQTFVIRESEKERRERIVMGSPPARSPASPGGPSDSLVGAPSSSPEDATSSGLGGQRTLGLVMGGVGIAGLGVGTIFGLLASSAWNRAKSACGGDTSHCSNVSVADADSSTMQTDGTVSTTAFVAGGVLLVAGTIVFLTGGHHAEREPTPGVAVVPDVGRGQGGVAIVGRF
jgi:hypothetical protein